MAPRYAFGTESFQLAERVPMPSRRGLLFVLLITLPAMFYAPMVIKKLDLRNGPYYGIGTAAATPLYYTQRTQWGWRRHAGGRWLRR